MTHAEKRAAEIEAAKKIRAQAQAEGRDLTAAELATVETHLKAASDAKAAEDAEAATAARRSQALADLDAADRAIGAPQPRKAPGAAAPAPARATEGFLEDPMRGFRSGREFLVAVRNASRGGPIPANLASLRAPMQAAAGSDEHSVAADTYGGFLAPVGVAAGVKMLGYDPDPIAALTQKIPMGTMKVYLNARVDKSHSTSVSGGLVVYRRAETQAVSSSRTQFEQVLLDANALMGLAFASEELLSASPESFAAILERGFRDEFGARGMIDRLDGSGAGEPLGVNNVTSGTHISTLEISKETGQAAATINYANLVKMRARCWGYGNAVWAANHDTLPALLSITAPGSTQPLLATNEQGVTTLMGRPVFFTEFAKTLGTAGDLVLGNWAEYLEGEYQPIQGASSVHVRFAEHEQAFKFWKVNAGIPWWRSVLTPKNGATLAPFVRLAARA